LQNGFKIWRITGDNFKNRGNGSNFAKCCHVMCYKAYVIIWAMAGFVFLIFGRAKTFKVGRYLEQLKILLQVSLIRIKASGKQRYRLQSIRSWHKTLWTLAHWQKRLLTWCLPTPKTSVQFCTTLANIYKTKKIDEHNKTFSAKILRTFVEKKLHSFIHSKFNKNRQNAVTQ